MIYRVIKKVIWGVVKKSFLIGLLITFAKRITRLFQKILIKTASKIERDRKQLKNNYNHISGAPKIAFEIIDNFLSFFSNFSLILHEVISNMFEAPQLLRIQTVAYNP